MNVLCDIGGTYARFAITGTEGPENLRKYTAADFPDFLSALTHYAKTASGTLSIATAACQDGNIWRFINQNRWIIDPQTIEKAGWRVKTILNDFEAAAWSLTDMPSLPQTVLKPAKGASSSLCLIGPGTGLGLAYLHNTPHGPFVQKTHGGHMPVSLLNPEQHEIADLTASGSTPVFENFVSGPGLLAIYNALGGKAQTPENLLAQKNTPEARKTLRLFHEFFGAFAATAVITGHAYGGLVLTGGVLDRLIEADAFDFKTFEKAFLLNVASSVRRDLEATPVIRITDQNPALKGLIAHG